MITRGNDRQDIFHVAEGYLKLLSLLASQKQKTHFSEIVTLDPSVVSRRCDAARLKLANDSKLKYAKEMVDGIYRDRP